LPFQGTLVRLFAPTYLDFVWTEGTSLWWSSLRARYHYLLQACLRPAKVYLGGPSKHNGTFEGEQVPLAATRHSAGEASTIKRWISGSMRTPIREPIKTMKCPIVRHMCSCMRSKSFWWSSMLTWSKASQPNPMGWSQGTHIMCGDYFAECEWAWKTYGRYSANE